jgi:hypothetical protein
MEADSPASEAARLADQRPASTIRIITMNRTATCAVLALLLTAVPARAQNSGGANTNDGEIGTQQGQIMIKGFCTFSAIVAPGQSRMRIIADDQACVLTTDEKGRTGVADFYMFDGEPGQYDMSYASRLTSHYSGEGRQKRREQSPGTPCRVRRPWIKISASSVAMSLRGQKGHVGTLRQSCSVCGSRVGGTCECWRRGSSRWTNSYTSGRRNALFSARQSSGLTPRRQPGSDSIRTRPAVERSDRL